jgi:hypothetical protein
MKAYEYRSNDFPAARIMGPQPEGKTDDCEKPERAVAE